MDGSWGKWGDWDLCSVTCGDGIQLRRRSCLNQAFGGADCPIDYLTMNGATEEKLCNLMECPGNICSIFKIIALLSRL